MSKFAKLKANRVGSASRLSKSLSSFGARRSTSNVSVHASQGVVKGQEQLEKYDVALSKIIKQMEKVRLVSVAVVCAHV